MTSGTLADLLKSEGLSTRAAEGSDDIAPCRSKTVPAASLSRDTAGTLKASCDAVSRMSRVSRLENQKVERDGSAQAPLNGAGRAGAAGNSSAQGRGVGRLKRAAEAMGLDPLRVETLNDACSSALAGLSDAALACYAVALIETAEREAGRVPKGWTVAAECERCGPVWLAVGSPAKVAACVWCSNRKAGRLVPGWGLGPSGA
jgi:hypothetical protein